MTMHLPYCAHDVIFSRKKGPKYASAEEQSLPLNGEEFVERLRDFVEILNELEEIDAFLPSLL